MLKSKTNAHAEICTTLRALFVISIVILVGFYMIFHLMKSTKNILGEDSNLDRDSMYFRDGVLENEDMFVKKNREKLKTKREPHEVRKKGDIMTDDSTTPEKLDYDSYVDATTPDFYALMMSQNEENDQLDSKTSFESNDSPTVSVPSSSFETPNTDSQNDGYLENSQENKHSTEPYSKPSSPSSIPFTYSITDINSDSIQDSSESKVSPSPPSVQSNDEIRNPENPKQTEPKITEPPNVQSSEQTEPHKITEPPSSWRPNPTIYTSPRIQKIAEEFMNSVTWHTTSEAGELRMTKSTGAPSTSGYPYQGVKDTDTRSRDHGVMETEIMSSETRSTRHTPSNEPIQHDKSLYSQYNIPTARPLPPPCFREAFKLKRVCSLNKQQKVIKGENITLEEVAQIVFSKSTLMALKDECNPSEWCLSEEQIQHRIDEKYAHFCDLQDCLLDITDDCMNEERKLILSTLFLMCSAREKQLSNRCLLSISKMTHVTMTDIYRIRFRPNQVVCHDADIRFNCSDACQNNARNLQCMSEMCNGTTELFSEFSPWSWYFRDGFSETCNITTNNCTLFEYDDELMYTWWNQILQSVTNLDRMDAFRVKAAVTFSVCFLSIMAGILIILITQRFTRHFIVFLFYVLAAVVWLCTKCIMRSRMRQYNREEVEYLILDSADFENYESDYWDHETTNDL